MVRGPDHPEGEYRLKIGRPGHGAVTARLVRIDGVRHGDRTSGSEVTVPGLTVGAGSGVRAELEVVGTSPTTLRVRVWSADGARPTTALLDTTDTTADLQVAGHTGLAALLSSTTTNVPVTVRVDDVSVVRAD